MIFLRVVYKDKHYFVYGDKGKPVFARSVKKYDKEIDEKDIKKIKLTFYDKFHYSGKKFSTFESYNIESILQETNINKDIAIKDISPEGKFIKFKNGYTYIYEINNDIIYIEKEKKKIEKNIISKKK